MPVTTQQTRFTFTGNGVTTTFAYGCRILSAAHIEVQLNGVVQTSGYSVFGVNNPSGGSVVFAVAPASGVQIILQRVMPIERATDYQSNGDLLEATLDDDQDAQTMLLQQVDASVQRAIRLADGDGSGADTTLPTPTANSAIAWDATGKKLINVILQAGTTLVSLAASSGAALVGFIQSGVGAVTRTVQDELRDRAANVKQFGVVGDGVTDDTTNITKALATGLPLMFPRGTYLTGQLSIPSSRSIFFDDATLKLKGSAPAYSSVLNLDGVSNVMLLGSLTVDGNKASQTNVGNSGQTGLLITNACSNIYVQRYRAINCTEDGLMISSYAVAANYPTNVHVGSAVIDGCGRNNVSITGGDGIRIDYLHATNAYNADGTGPAAGIDIEANSNAYTLRNIHIGTLVSKGNAGPGLQVLGYLSAGGAYLHGRVTIDKLVCENNAKSNVVLQNCYGVSARGAVIRTSTAFNGIELRQAVRDIDFSGSLIESNSRSGVMAVLGSPGAPVGNWNFSGCTIIDNNTGNTSRPGMQLSGSASYPVRGVDVDGCDFRCTAGALQTYGLQDDGNTSEIRGAIQHANNAIGGTNVPIGGVRTKQRGFKATAVAPGAIAAGTTVAVTVAAPVSGTCSGGDLAIGRPLSGLNWGIVTRLQCGNNNVTIYFTNTTGGLITPASDNWWIETFSFY